MTAPRAGLFLLLALLVALPRADSAAAAPQPGAAAGSGAAPEDLLPPSSYDPAVPRPADVLGWEVGEWHVRHDQLVRYVETLAEASDRVALEVQGYSHEERPLPLLTLTSPANHARLDEILRRHRALSEPPFPEPQALDRELADLPPVVWLGYSIHGNEASGSNAALLVAYHLAAGQDRETERLLDQVVILIDPSMNPDGLSRFAQWANMHKGRVLVADRAHREHNEGWPSGRTNHYWFDLNRDWLPVQHPESRARVATLQRWRPNLLADFHEMGSDSTYFFQPGVPSRQNPLTPAENLELTRRIARYHAAAFDEAGRLYYSEETFDDFYYGKGSTYPDIQGSIGILFEQASARGHLAETRNGLLSFTEAIGGQVLTSFSTLKAAQEMGRELQAYQVRFYRQALEAARQAPAAAWLLGDGGDPVRAWRLLELLRTHGVEVRELARPVTVEGTPFRPGHAWAVPVEQRQYRLLEALFERRTEFPDETFYDVSAWTLPLAFDLPVAELPRRDLEPALLGAAVTDPAPPRGRFPEREVAAAEPYAWLFEWDGYYAPRALHRLLSAGVVARVATRPFEVETDAGRRPFGYGTILVPRGLQSMAPEELAGRLARVAELDGVDVWAAESGLTASGIDFGSPSLRPVELPRPLLVVGEGVSAYEAGEMWYLLDHRYQVPLPMVERDRLGETDLDRYTHVILVDGRWNDLPGDATGALRAWLEDGGTVLATQSAARWAATALAGEGGTADDGGPETTRRVEARAAGTDPPEGAPETAGTYAEFEKQFAVGLISGAIFETRLDRTHPLAFGFDDDLLPVFRDGARPMEPSDNPYENVALFTDRPLLAGYASPDNVERIAGSAAVLAQRVGDGTLVRLSDDPTFRAFWYGTDRLVLNSLFFGPVVKRTALPSGY